MENSFISSLNLSHSEFLSLEEDIRAFTYAINLKPEDYYAYLSLGQTLYKRSHLDKSIKAYNLSISFKP